MFSFGMKTWMQKGRSVVLKLLIEGKYNGLGVPELRFIMMNIGTLWLIGSAESWDIRATELEIQL